MEREMAESEPFSRAWTSAVAGVLLGHLPSSSMDVQAELLDALRCLDVTQNTWLPYRDTVYEVAQRQDAAGRAARLFLADHRDRTAASLLLTDLALTSERVRAPSEGGGQPDVAVQAEAAQEALAVAAAAASLPLHHEIDQAIDVRATLRQLATVEPDVAIEIEQASGYLTVALARDGGDLDSLLADIESRRGLFDDQARVSDDLMSVMAEAALPDDVGRRARRAFETPEHLPGNALVVLDPGGELWLKRLMFLVAGHHVAEMRSEDTWRIEHELDSLGPGIGVIPRHIDAAAANAIDYCHGVHSDEPDVWNSLALWLAIGIARSGGGIELLIRELLGTAASLPSYRAGMIGQSISRSPLPLEVRSALLSAAREYQGELDVRILDLLLRTNRGIEDAGLDVRLEDIGAEPRPLSRRGIQRWLRAYRQSTKLDRAVRDTLLSARHHARQVTAAMFALSSAHPDPVSMGAETVVLIDDELVDAFDPDAATLYQVVRTRVPVEGTTPRDYLAELATWTASFAGPRAIVAAAQPYLDSSDERERLSAARFIARALDYHTAGKHRVAAPIGMGGPAVGEGLPEDVAIAGSAKAAIANWLTNVIPQYADISPRVLNANFAQPKTRRVIGERVGLIGGQPYDLLVDVGPRWSKIPSIVRGHAEFPEESLPPDADGHEIDVLLISDDFEPELVSGRMWVPRSNGRSHPITDTGPAPESGPIALRVTAPQIVNPRAKTYRARGRLYLYFEQNLLQSALVTVGVVRADEMLDRPNRVDVDYVLSATFNDVAARFGQRRVGTGSDDATREHPVRVNITLNSDGSGTHRIIVQGRDDLPTAWTTYDPAAARQSLETARRELVDCFWQRDEHTASVRVNERGSPVPGLGLTNGKSRDQFLLDLLALAKVGNRLYDEMVHSVHPAGNEPQLEWERSLRSTLARSSIIQIARLDWTPGQYAFPWALLYDYPMPGVQSAWRWCDVWNEWSPDGVRNLPIVSSCPFASQPWHVIDVLCPYGFWGLKHIIEQPLRAAPAGEDRLLRDAVHEVMVPPKLSISIGWTRDAALDLASIDQHVDRIRRSPRIRLAEPSPNPGDDRATMAALVAHANLIYFLCHCETAADQNQPYLSVGPRDGAEGHRIYSTTITDWARSGLPDWARLRPIVVINGCHTSDIKPGEVLNLVAAFGIAGASGVIGTDVSVQLPIAIDIGEQLVDKLVNRDGMTIGQALREVRWEYANKGNLLALAYGAYGLADLGFVREPR